LEQLQVQPNNVHLEESLLGCLLMDPEQFWKTEPFITTDDLFYTNKNKRLYSIIRRMSHNGEVIDTMTVCSNLSKKDKQDGLDMYYITGLNNDMPTAAHSVQYAKKLYEDYLYREIIKKSHIITQKSYDGNASVYPLVSETYNALGEILDLRPTDGFNIDEEVDNTLKDIEKGGENILQSGWSKVDTLSGGFTKGEVSIVAGRPGHGKTTILINMLANFIEQGYKVMLFNRELPIKEVLKKLMVLESGKLSYRQIRNTGIDSGDAEEVQRVSDILRTKYHKDVFQMYDKISDFDGAAVEIRKFKPDIVIDDYVQLIKGNRNRQYEARRLELEDIVNNYKWLAKHNECVVILASQLNRLIEYRGVSTEPQLSDLAESGAIEQVAENVFFTFYQWKINPEKKSTSPHKMKFIAKKVRYGETGYVMLGYDGDKCKVYGSFTEYKKMVDK
tara:strand:- start:838 stop:2175 length:1338 start_codon:yes stop_codon:yes gene_type:complete